MHLDSRVEQQFQWLDDSSIHANLQHQSESELHGDDYRQRLYRRPMDRRRRDEVANLHLHGDAALAPEGRTQISGRSRIDGHFHDAPRWHTAASLGCGAARRPEGRGDGTERHDFRCGGAPVWMLTWALFWMAEPTLTGNRARRDGQRPADGQPSRRGRPCRRN